MRYYAIIVAGGSGNRMKNAIPKQFLLLDGKPILMHSIEKFYNCELNPAIIVVLSEELQSKWLRLCSEYQFSLPYQLVNGGIQRFHSVKNALDTISGTGVVAIHDAARPLISDNLIVKSFQVAVSNGNSVAGIPPTDSVRYKSENGATTALERNKLTLVQTPQTFDIELLKTAYQSPYTESFTDDASVFEKAGFMINMIEGEKQNIKITYPEDLELAAILIHKRNASKI